MKYYKEDILKLGDDKEYVVVDSRIMFESEYYLIVNIENNKDFFFVTYVYKDGKDYVKKISDEINVSILIGEFRRKE